jgi:hypothetical protein
MCLGWAYIGYYGERAGVVLTGYGGGGITWLRVRIGLVFIYFVM